MLLIVGGIFGSLIGGYILDRTKAYKYVKAVRFLLTNDDRVPRKVTFGVYVFSFASMVLFTSTVHLHESVAFITMFLVG